MSAVEDEKRFLSAAAGVSSATELAKSLYKIPNLLTTYTRCGKTNCRCTRGELHGPYYALYWREGGGWYQRRCYVKAVEVPAVQAILARRTAARRWDRLEHKLAFDEWDHLRALAAELEARLLGEGEDVG